MELRVPIFGQGQNSTCWLTLPLFTVHPAKPQEAVARVGLIIVISFRRRTCPAILTRMEVTHVLRIITDCCHSTDDFFGFWIPVRFTAKGTLHKTSEGNSESTERLHGFKWVVGLHSAESLVTDKIGPTCFWYDVVWRQSLPRNFTP